MELGAAALAIENDSDDEDAEDDEVRQTDALLILAMTEDDFSHLEVQIYSEDGNLYVHHDISLPDFPICLAWLDCPPYTDLDGSQLQVNVIIEIGHLQSMIAIVKLGLVLLLSKGG